MQPLPGISGIQILIEPNEHEIRNNFAPHVVERILRHLDTETGDVSRGEFQCTRIASIIWNRFSIRVFYETKRPDGTNGTQFMDFSHFTDMIRCLPLTVDGHVVMIQEHRRTRGEWVQMLPAGGEKKGTTVNVLLEELLDETGCTMREDSRIILAARRFMDDGAHSERVSLVTVDHLRAPRAHKNPSEGIRGIMLVPFDEWKCTALNGKYDDSFSEWFAGRCDYDRTTQKITVRGIQQRLR